MAFSLTGPCSAFGRDTTQGEILFSVVLNAFPSPDACFLPLAPCSSPPHPSLALWPFLSVLRRMKPCTQGQTLPAEDRTGLVGQSSFKTLHRHEVNQGRVSFCCSHITQWIWQLQSTATVFLLMEVTPFLYLNS